MSEWDVHYKRFKDYVICKYCEKQISTKGMSTSGLKRHYKKKGLNKSNKVLFLRKIAIFLKFGFSIHATYRESAGSRDPEKSHYRLPNPDFSKSRDLANTIFYKPTPRLCWGNNLFLPSQEWSCMLLLA